MSLFCKKCKLIPKSESDLDLHHIIPRGLGGKDLDGRMYLCSAQKGNDCHRKLHIKIKEWLKRETESWLTEEEHKKEGEDVLNGGSTEGITKK